MKHKERAGQITADIIVLYVSLLLLCFICRLWPVILLAILGLFVVMIRMVFLSMGNKDKSEKTDIELPVESRDRQIFTRGELEMAVFQDFKDQVNEFVLSHWKDASWCFEKADARQRIFAGADLYIRLDHTGGYKRAKVIYQGLKVYGLKYGNTKNHMGNNQPDDDPIEPPVVNFSMIAFEWCEANLSEINERIEKAFTENKAEVLIPIDELPVPDSYEDICKEILRRLNRDAKILTDGIIIIL